MFATITFLSSARAVIEYAVGHEWQGFETVEIRRADRGALYECAYNHACVRALAIGLRLEVFRVA